MYRLGDGGGEMEVPHAQCSAAVYSMALKIFASDSIVWFSFYVEIFYGSEFEAKIKFYGKLCY